MQTKTCIKEDLLPNYIYMEEDLLPKNKKNPTQDKILKSGRAGFR